MNVLTEDLAADQYTGCLWSNCFHESGEKHLGMSTVWGGKPHCSVLTSSISFLFMFGKQLSSASN